MVLSCFSCNKSSATTNANQVWMATTKAKVGNLANTVFESSSRTKSLSSSNTLNQLNKKPAIAGERIKLIFLRIFMRGRDYPRLTCS
jgi:hypothetical protein